MPFVLVSSQNPIRYTYLKTLLNTKSNWSEKSEKSVKESKSRPTFCYESDVILNTNNWLSKKWKWNKNNRPFPSSLVPLFRSESKWKTFHMKMSSACSFFFMQIKVIFIRMVSHIDSVWNRGTRELGNGLSNKLSSYQLNLLQVKSHWFDPCPVLRLFLCPTLVSYWSVHFSHQWYTL